MELDSCSSAMFPGVMLSHISQQTTISSSTSAPPPKLHPQPDLKTKKKRNQPGNPDPEAEVIALSPRTLLATNRFVCEVCNKGFQRDQNLQLHRRGHNLPWKLKQRSSKENKKRAYVCPEPACVHHHPSRALGDLTGIKKHFSRKHGEKKWKCEKCSKVYAVQSDWKAHSKICGTREYRCDCGTLFTRKDSFITHRAFCDVLAEESARLSGVLPENSNYVTGGGQSFHFKSQPIIQSWPPPPAAAVAQNLQNYFQIKHENLPWNLPPPALHLSGIPPPLSATTLLQKATTVGLATGHVGYTAANLHMHGWNISNGFTRDFLGLAVEQYGGGRSDDGDVRNLLSFNGGVNGYADNCSETWRNC